MKKDKLFGLLQDFIYGLEPDGQELEERLVGAGVKLNELWNGVDGFLKKIAEKYGED